MGVRLCRWFLELNSFGKFARSFSLTAVSMAGKVKRKRVIDFEAYKFRHIALKFAYFGWDYDGLVVQKDTANTVLESVLEGMEKTQMIAAREACGLVCCGRTDKGVSAAGQAISLRVRSLLDGTDGRGFVEESGPGLARRKEIPTEEMDYVFLLNRVLPRDIRVLAWAPVPLDFSARFRCKERVYKYLFPRGSLDIEAMREAAARFLGEHDFRNFCKSTPDVSNYVRTVLSIEIGAAKRHESDPSLDLMTCRVRGTAFLYHQIRCMMATLLLVGNGQEAPQVVDQLLDLATCSAKPQYQLALEMPLVFCEAEFDDVPWRTSEVAHRDLLSSLQTAWAQSAIRTSIISMTLEKVKEQNSSCEYPSGQTDFLCGDLRARNYKPLLKRPREDPVEEKIRRGEEKKRRKAEELNST